jgi:hypothetical protein
MATSLCRSSALRICALPIASPRTIQATRFHKIGTRWGRVSKAPDMKKPRFRGFSYSGGGIRTRDLRVMSTAREFGWNTWSALQSGFREIKLHGNRLASVGLVAPFVGPARLVILSGCQLPPRLQALRPAPRCKATVGATLDPRSDFDRPSLHWVFAFESTTRFGFRHKIAQSVPTSSSREPNLRCSLMAASGTDALSTARSRDATAIIGTRSSLGTKTGTGSTTRFSWPLVGP